MWRAIRQMRLSTRRATLFLSCAVMSCAEDFLGTPNPPSPPSIFHHSERFLQRGISSGNPSQLVPDEPFEFWLITSGVEGRVDVGVATVSDGVAVVRARLEFQIPAGCEKSHGVLVSSLPAGYEYILSHTVTATPSVPNPCPNAGHDVASLHWHPPVSFRALPVSATPLSEITITRLLAP